MAIYAAGTAIATGQVLTGSNVATQINLYSSQTGVTAALAATGALQLTAADGRDITQTETVTAGTGGTGARRRHRGCHDQGNNHPVRGQQHRDRRRGLC